jgi:hypothetical protein
MDEQKLETLGYKPLAGELQRIRTLKDKKGVPALVATCRKIGVATPVRHRRGARTPRNRRNTRPISARAAWACRTATTT